MALYFLGAFAFGRCGRQYPGIGFAILEKASSVFPFGTEIEFKVANVVANRMLSAGGMWNRTLLGRYATSAGFELDQLFREPSGPTALLTKTHAATSVFFRLGLE